MSDDARGPRPRLERVAATATRATGVLFALLATFAFVQAARAGSAAGLVVAGLTGALSLGLWTLHRFALALAPALLVLLALVLPLGLLSPFAAMEIAPAERDRPGFVAGRIALAFGLAALCLALAYLIGRARTFSGRAN